MPDGLVRVRVDLAYDGTDFAGWAHQPGRRTVQGVLEEALEVLVRGPAPRVTVAGRTDAGVHAHGQVCHADLPEPVAHDPRLLRRLNGLLPEDVRVRRTADAPEHFDARFSAIWRTYRYRVSDGAEQLDPLRRHDTLAWHKRLELEAMQAACTGLVGVHDFAAYCRRRDGATTTRGVLELSWERREVLEMTVTADAFCHSMVRSLVGAFLAVGDGRSEPSWMTDLLTLGRRAEQVVVAPPHGLSLQAVGYPPDDELLARQLLTRRLRA